MAKISEAQRKYFVNRVEGQIDEVIGTLTHKNASRTIEISESQYENYLGELGVKDKLAELLLHKEACDKLTDDIRPVLETIRKALELNNNDYNYQQWVYISDSTNAREWTKAFRQCCDKAALKSEGVTEIGKEINILREKKKKAVDFLYGFSEENELKVGVNHILSGTGITLLEETNNG